MDEVSYTTKDTFEQIIKCNGKKHNIVTIKIPLKKIYSRPDNSDDLDDLDDLREAVKNVNKIIDTAYVFIKGYVLNIIENKIEHEPIIDKKFIKLVFKVINTEQETTEPLEETNLESKSESTLKQNSDLEIESKPKQVPKNKQVPKPKRVPKTKQVPKNGSIPKPKPIPKTKSVSTSKSISNTEPVPKIDSNLNLEKQLEPKIGTNTKTEVNKLPEKSKKEIEKELKIKQLNHLKEYFKIFSEKTGIKPTNLSKLSYIFEQEQDKMLTCIINNIKAHFTKHLRQFIKMSFHKEFLDVREAYKTQYKGINLKKMLNKYYAELEKVKADMLSNSTKRTSLERYHEWIDNNIHNIIPNTYTECDFDVDIEHNTFSYLKCMYFMNNYLQVNNFKSYNILPLKRSLSNGYIKINTGALIDLFYGNKFYCSQDISWCFANYGDSNFQEKLWNIVFKFKNKGKYIFGRKDYKFNYEIETDGFGVSLNMIHVNQISKNDTKKANFAKGRKKKNEQKEILTDDELKTIEDEKKQTQKDKSKQKRERENKQKEDYAKLTPEAQKNVKLKLNAASEFPYLDKILMEATEEMRKLFLKKFKKGEIIVADPGKRSILYMLSCAKETNISYKEYKKRHKPKPREEPDINKLIKEIEDSDLDPIKKRRKIAKVRYKYFNKSCTYMLSCAKETNISYKEYKKRHKPKPQEKPDINKLIKEIEDSDLDPIKKRRKIAKVRYNYYNKSSTNDNNFGIKNYKDHKIFNYTSGTRSKFIGTNKRFKLINKWKRRVDKEKIPKDATGNKLSWYNKSLQDIETELSYYESKSCNHEKFLKYVKKRVEYTEKFEEQYNEDFIKRLRWKGHINKIKHEANLIRKIKETFGKNIIIVIGDWSGAGNVHYKPTPNVAIKRTLAKHFKIFLMDEYLTSALHHKSLTRCENLEVPTLGKVPKKPNPKNRKKAKNKKCKMPEVNDNIPKPQILNDTSKIEESKINITKKIKVRGHLNKKIKEQHEKEIAKSQHKETLTIKGETCILVPESKGNPNVKECQEIITITPEELPLKPDLPIDMQQKIYPMKPVHSVLLFKNKKTEMGCTHTVFGCINRDLNAVLNDNNIIRSLLLNGTRPEEFKRGNVQVDTNSNISGNPPDPEKVLREKSTKKSNPTKTRLKVNSKVQIKKS